MTLLKVGGGGAGVGAVRISRTLTALNVHAVDDYSTLAPTATGLGYSSFDSFVSLTALSGVGSANHLVGYQARMDIAGTADIESYVSAFSAQLRHSGSGNIPALNHLSINDISGAGPVGVDTAISIAPITRGTTANWAIYSQGGNSYFAGGIRIDGVLDLRGSVSLTDAVNIALGSTTGTKIGTATTQKLGFFNATPVVQQTDGAALTNNVTSGGTTNTIADFTSLSVYATDAAAIRNNIYQLARKLKIVDDALRTFGLLS